MRTRETSQPPDVLPRLRVSLGAAEVYVRILLVQLELASTSDLVSLERIPASALAELTHASHALQASGHRTLHHLDPSLAQRTRTLADLAHTPRVR